MDDDLAREAASMTPEEEDQMYSDLLAERMQDPANHEAIPWEEFLAILRAEGDKAALEMDQGE